jgi:hypothetical protein
LILQQFALLEVWICQHPSADVEHDLSHRHRIMPPEEDCTVAHE